MLKPVRYRTLGLGPTGFRSQILTLPAISYVVRSG